MAARLKVPLKYFHQQVKRFRFLSTIVFVGIVLALITTGCASLAPKQQGIIPPGFSQGPWKHLKASGVAEDAQYMLFLPWRPIGRETIFPATVPQVTWYGYFQPFAFGGVALYGRTFVARWYAPGGNLFWEEEFQALKLDQMYAKVSLPIKDNPAQEHLGRWFVQIYHQGELIDEKYFILNLEPSV